jgi:hypothetical protein
MGITTGMEDARGNLNCNIVAEHKEAGNRHARVEKILRTSDSD